MGHEATSTTKVACPHCHKSFTPRLLAGGAERLRGYKCPHCKLFLPESRAEDAPLSRDRNG
jgi:transposase-like protein